MSEPVKLTESERNTFEGAFWANIAKQADDGPHTDLSWLCDNVADTVAEMLAAARQEDDNALRDMVNVAKAAIARVEALAEAAQADMDAANAEVEAEAGRPSTMRAFVLVDDLRAALAGEAS